MKLPLAALLLTLPLAASAQTYNDEGEYWAAQYEKQVRAAQDQAKKDKEAADARSKAAEAQRQAAAKALGECGQNTALNGPTGFAFKIEGKIEMSFLYGTCADEGGKAVRTYWADQAGYSLRIETAAGSAQSKLSVIEQWAGGASKTAADLGTRDTASLLAQAGADLGTVTLSDTRGDAKTSYKGRASLKAGQYSQPSNDEPRGCQ
jgi:hypothetical protein